METYPHKIMADDTVITQEQAVDPQVAAKAELDQLMAQRFGTAQPTQAVQDENVNRGTSSSEPAVVVEAEVVPEFKFDTFKEKFGYEKPEDITAEIESLRAFKATPQTAAEIKFENDQSKLLFEALKAGKTNEVRAYLVEQERLERTASIEVNDETAEDVIKAGMSLRYKDLSPKEIDYKYNKQFGLPKQPVQGADEELEDFEERKSAWNAQVADIKMERQIEAKTFKPEINNAKAKLVLPEITQNVDQNYLDWKKDQEELEAANATVYEAYSKLKPSEIQTKVAYIDEANKVNFEFDYVPDEKSFKQTQDLVTDIDKFYARFKNSDGSPNRTGFFAAIDFAINKDKVISTAIKQGITAYIKGQLPDNQRNDIQRENVVVFEKSELDKLMESRGITRV